MAAPSTGNAGEIRRQAEQLARQLAKTEATKRFEEEHKAKLAAAAAAAVAAATSLDAGDDDEDFFSDDASDGEQTVAAMQLDRRENESEMDRDARIASLLKEKTKARREEKARKKKAAASARRAKAVEQKGKESS